MKLKVLALIFFILFLPSVLGFGATSRVTLDYNPGITVDLEVCVKPDGEDTITLTPSGAWAEHITIDEGPHDITDTKCFPYTLYMPPETETQGTLQNIIMVKQAPKKGEMMSVAVGVKHQIRVEIPYEGKYGESTIYVANSNAGEEIPITITLVNRGDEVIPTLRAAINIKKGEELIETIDTNLDSNIGPEEQGVIKGIWNSEGAEAGIYTAIATLNYEGGGEKQLQRNFKIGERDVLISGHTNELIKGGVREFHITAESIWSEPIQGVKAKVNIQAPGAQEFESFPWNLQPWQKYNLLGYANTENIPVGEYPVTIELSYDGGSKIETSTISIINEPILEEPKQTGNNNLMLLAGIGGALIIILLITIVVILLKRK